MAAAKPSSEARASRPGGPSAEAVEGSRLRGDEAELFAAHHARLLAGLTRHLGGHRDVAEEACALAWMQLLRYQPDRGPRLVGWLFTVAKHEAYRLLRQQARQPADADPDSRIDHTGSGEPFQRLARSEQLALIDQLPPRQRLALGLHVRGYSYREICVLSRGVYVNVVVRVGADVDDMSPTDAVVGLRTR